MAAARSAVTEGVQAEAALAFGRSHGFPSEGAFVVLVRTWNPRVTEVREEETPSPPAKGTAGSLNQGSRSVLDWETDSASSGKSSGHQIAPQS